MNVAEQCPRCGGRLTTAARAGLCARCLLTAALEQPSRAEGLPVPGQQIGSCRVVRLLGQGGMGMVYLAEQDEPIARPVALKIIKLGMDTRAVLARFQSEQQTLARMDHPCIAQVYEAGANADGRPYFVMEYVPGVPVTEYCDRHRLDTRQRLALFLQVAQAVQHAHQKGVIHRDLKPSNILVMERDGEAVPKIIDFGLARATEKNFTQETLFTEAGMLIGTPEYMSPEQASLPPHDLDTRTDIYSLGVLLYELLVGTVPFEAKALRSAGYDEIRRIIRETDPPAPVTRLDSLGAGAAEIASRRGTDARGLRRELRGELEWIILKTLEKDRSRRYSSAWDLAEDVRRRLAGEPVLAAPPDAIYRLRKFAARHVPQFVAASVVLLALLAGLVLSTTYYLRSEYQRERIERQNYVANLAAAEQLLRLKQSEPARELLLACAPGMRGWEWRHLWRLSDSSRATQGALRRTEQAATAMAIASRTASVAMGLETGAVEILAPDGTLVQRWQAHADGIRALALSPDGTRLLTAGRDGGARFWDVPSKRLISGLLGAPVTSVAYGPGGRGFATGSGDGTALFWQAETLRVAQRIATGQPIDWVGFIPDGSGLATAGGGAVRLWLLPSGKARHTFPAAGLAAFSRDGMLAVTAAPGKTEARVWNARWRGEARGILHTGSEVVSAVFIPRESRIAVATREGGLQIWNLPYCDHLLTLHAAPGLRTVLCSPDGRRLLGLYEREVRVWDTASAQPPPQTRPGPYGEAVSGSAWTLLRGMLAGGIFVLLIAGALCSALFRRRQLRAVMDRWFAQLPLGFLPWRAARAGRWVARVLGSLLALLFLVIAIGEGMWPPPGDVRLMLLFAGFCLMTAGLIVAWVWEALGGLCALAGYAIFLAIVPVTGNLLFLIVVAVSLLHILCWLRLRAETARARL